ncbi:hypothetical protein Tco_0900953 [Tanacetum coccineum]
MSIPHNNMGPPPPGPPPPNNNGPPPMVIPNGPAPRSMEELCQPSIDGWGGPIAPIPIQATDFGLCHHMIQQPSPKLWDTSATRDETSRNISSTTTTESPEVVRQLEMMNKNFVEMMRQIQMIKSVDMKCETCGGPHSFTECPTTDGYTQEATYATTGDVKAITTRSGVAYDGLTFPPTHSPLSTGSGTHEYTRNDSSVNDEAYCLKSGSLCDTTEIIMSKRLIKFNVIDVLVEGYALRSSRIFSVVHYVAIHSLGSFHRFLHPPVTPFKGGDVSFRKKSMLGLLNNLILGN